MANWVKTIPNLAGFLDLRSYGQMRMFLRPILSVFAEGKRQCLLHTPTRANGRRRMLKIKLKLL